MGMPPQKISGNGSDEPIFILFIQAIERKSGDARHSMAVEFPRHIFHILHLGFNRFHKKRRAVGFFNFLAYAIKRLRGRDIHPSHRALLQEFGTDFLCLLSIPAGDIKENHKFAVVATFRAYYKPY